MPIGATVTSGVEREIVDHLLKAQILFCQRADT